jgi:hypothetical protein
MSQLPPLKTDPKYGYFPRWPEEGEAWVHPEDVALVRSLIPSGRIFRRDGISGKLVVMHYGNVSFRVHRTLWQEVAHEGFDIGDWVEVLTRGMTNEPHTGQIVEMQWDDMAHAIRYRIVERGQPIPALYGSADLRHIDPTDAKLSGD